MMDVALKATLGIKYHLFYSQTCVEFINIIILGMKKWNANFQLYFSAKSIFGAPTWSGVEEKSRDEIKF